MSCIVNKILVIGYVAVALMCILYQPKTEKRPKTKDVGPNTHKEAKRLKFYEDE